MDLQVQLAEAREQRAHLQTLLTERLAAGETARAQLDQHPPFPCPHREIEAELRAAESDVAWISQDLHALVSRERLLEAALGQMMADDLALAAAEKARTVKVAKSKGKGEGVVADASTQKDSATAGA
jgi:hypothetical protein